MNGRRSREPSSAPSRIYTLASRFEMLGVYHVDP